MKRALAAVVALATFASGPSMARTPEPPFTLVGRAGAVELRDYEPQIVAEVTARGERSQAAGRGFRPLASYIFGDNAPRQTIAMTAPVTSQRVRRGGEKIAMTAPVTQTADGQDWRVRFIMPEGYTMAGLPAPNDPDVRLIAEPARRMAVIRFSGFAPEALLERKTADLRAAAAAEGLRLTGEPIYAFYDPPWTPPWARRNEVMIEVAR